MKHILHTHTLVKQKDQERGKLSPKTLLQSVNSGPAHSPQNLLAVSLTPRLCNLRHMVRLGMKMGPGQELGMGPELNLGTRMKLELGRGVELEVVMGTKLGLGIGTELGIGTRMELGLGTSL